MSASWTRMPVVSSGPAGWSPDASSKTSARIIPKYASGLMMTEAPQYKPLLLWRFESPKNSPPAEQADSRQAVVGTEPAGKSVRTELPTPDDTTCAPPRYWSFDMQRPDTIIEIHRERVQDQTVDMFSGDKYTQSVDGTGYSATATLDLTVDRVWFILDSHQRLWQEETDGELADPLRHFAIDL